MVAIVEQAVAVVDRRHRGKEVALEGVLRIVVEDGGGATDRLWPEAGARTVGRGGIEGNAPDDGVDTLQLLRIFAAHEGENAGMRRIGCRRCE